MNELRLAWALEIVRLEKKQRKLKKKIDKHLEMNRRPSEQVRWWVDTDPRGRLEKIRKELIWTKARYNAAGKRG